jgi:hypothetical protein
MTVFSEKCCGLFDIDQECLKESMGFGSGGEVWSAVMAPSMARISFYKYI